MFVSLRRVCVVYVIKEVVSFWWLSQLMGWRVKERMQLILISVVAI